MRTHVAQGEEIVNGMGWLEGANAVVAAHPRKWNGSGYPRQLGGEDIPLAARILPWPTCLTRSVRSARTGADGL